MTASAVTPLLSNHQAPLRQQKGYSIIELSIALAIISIILVTALAGVQRILRSNNVNEDLKNLNLMASKVTVMLTNVANTAGITQANLVNLRAFEGLQSSRQRRNQCIRRKYHGCSQCCYSWNFSHQWRFDGLQQPYSTRSVQ